MAKADREHKATFRRIVLLQQRGLNRRTEHGVIPRPYPAYRGGYIAVSSTSKICLQLHLRPHDTTEADRSSSIISRMIRSHTEAIRFAGSIMKAPAERQET
jgi:hypothetical protein